MNLKNSNNDAHEHSRLEKVANWYSPKQGFMGRLACYGFQSLRPYFVGSKCLELGPGDGPMTRMLLDAFQSVTCVDGSPSFCQKLRDSFGDFKGFKVECSLFEKYCAPSPFNTILAAHVLEHVEDPVHVLQRIKGWLSQEGVLLVLVPNTFSFHRLAAVKMGLLSAPEQLNELDHRLGHRRVYNLKLLLEHLNSAGWEVQTTGGVFFKVFTNQQIENWFTEPMMDGFYELGKDFPAYAAEIYAVCRLRKD